MAIKNPQTSEPASAAGSYRIASVATLTGIPAPTIRIWERRYGLVRPHRSAGNLRLYSQADIQRLVLVKAAVDAGHPISTVAELGADQLRERAQDAPRQQAIDRAVRVAVYGDALAGLLSDAWKSRADIRLVAHPLEDVFAKPPRADAADVTIVEVASLQDLSIEALRRLNKAGRSSLTLVIYSIGGSKSLAGIDREGIIALPAPVNAAHLARLCLLNFSGMAAAQPMRSAAPRRFDDAQLAKINQMPNAVDCECPNHLSDLLIRINAFEQYNYQCEDRNAEDASLHVMMAEAAVRCRELLEYALSRAIEHADLEASIPEPAKPTVKSTGRKK
ncbi:MerR family transcriptional regulator [Rhodanobacter sp. BL-MT-08]